MNGWRSAPRARKLVVRPQGGPAPSYEGKRRLPTGRWLATCLLGTTTFFPLAALAQSTWVAVGGTGSFSTASNWSPATVPLGSSATGKFTDTGAQTVTISASYNVGTFEFSSTAQAYTFEATGGNNGLSFLGSGIVNNSANAQTFKASGVVLGGTSSGYSFLGSATAGNAIFVLTGGGYGQFRRRVERQLGANLGQRQGCWDEWSFRGLCERHGHGDVGECDDLGKRRRCS